MTQSNGDDRISALEARVGRLEGEFRESAELFLDGLRALSAQTTNLANRIDGLTDRVDNLTVIMAQFAQQAERDRQQAAEDRAEIRRIWEYLEAQLRSRGNGQG